MVRLIVEDAGNRRAFNVGEGRLSVGSAPEAKLKLDAQGVAGLHAEIEVHGGKATLHPKPGVTPPHVFGRVVNGPVVLQHGVPVKIGAAVLTVEYEGHPVHAPAGASKPREPLGRSSPRERGPKKGEEEAPAGRRLRKQGVPTWVWIAVGLPVLGLVGWGLSSMLLEKDSRGTGTSSAPAYVNNARDRLKNSQYELALQQLDRIPADAVLDPALAAEVAKMRQEIEQKITEGKENAQNNMAGKRYFESQVKGFADRYMSGTPTSQEVRVFMKRAQYFRAKWPTHTELDWVARQEARFKDKVDLTQPATFEDIQFEVESLLWSHPRKYDEAFAVVRAFQATASGADAAKASQLLGELEAQRTAWFEDRLEQARFHFQRKETGKSISVLLSIIRHAGDEKMADQGAERLIQFEGFGPEWLRGYRANEPENFAVIAKNRVMAAYIRENPL